MKVKQGQVSLLEKELEDMAAESGERNAKKGT
jgi:hypothetical protein